MCGLIGFSGKNNYNIDKLKGLFIYNTLERGDDSIGIFSPTNGVYKKAGKPVNLLPKMEIKSDNYFIGHVRSTTSGLSNDANAHPFIHDNVIGAMNGTTKNHWQLCDKYDLSRQDFNVDSDIIFAIIKKNKDFRVLGEIIGGCAILVHDKNNPKILYAFRNKERPLFRGMIGEDMYISSIEESLKIIGCDRVCEFKENYVYTIIDGKIAGNYKIKINIYNPGPDLSGKVDLVSNELRNKCYPGRWMFFDSPNSTYTNYNASRDPACDNFTKDKWYLCVGFNKNNEFEVIVRDDNNNDTMISYYKFTYFNSFPKSGHPLLILNNLTHGKNDESLVKKDDIVMLVEYGNKYIKIKKHIDDKTVWLLDFDDARPLSIAEKYERKEDIQEVMESKKPVQTTLPLGVSTEIVEEAVSDISPGPKTDPFDDQTEDIPNDELELTYITVNKLQKFIENIEYSLDQIKESKDKTEIDGYVSEAKEYINKQVEIFLGND